MSEEARPAIRAITGRDTRGRFTPGHSGNPSGRRKRLESEAETLEQIYTLAPVAVEKLGEILNSETTKPETLLRCIEIIFDRLLGTAVPREKIVDFEMTAGNVAEYLQRVKAVSEEYY